jgi:transposase
MRDELTDFEWDAIKPMLPNKPRGVPRMDDREHKPATKVVVFQQTVRWLVAEVRSDIS